MIRRGIVLIIIRGILPVCGLNKCVFGLDKTQSHIFGELIDNSLINYHRYTYINACDEYFWVDSSILGNFHFSVLTVITTYLAL